MGERNILEASFRDPAGYVFEEGGRIKRLVTRAGSDDYRKLMSSGLYERLAKDGLLVRHIEEAHSPSWPAGAEAILQPDLVPFVSYPYEWSFGQLKDAALLTLRIQALALTYGMSLKDASAFNVQFQGAEPVFIDTLSFETNNGGPWPGYGQFCRHFVAPPTAHAALVGSGWIVDARSLDGFPLDFVSHALPWRTYLHFGCLMHIHLHARSQRKWASRPPPTTVPVLPALDPKPVLAESLRLAVESLKQPRGNTPWANYYAEAQHYSAEAEAAKREAVLAALEIIGPRLVYDLGGNTGAYSRLATARGAYCVSFDLDPACVQLNYMEARRQNDANLLPLVMDFANPSPGLGFASRERPGLESRPKADLLLGLALVHHLRVSVNVPFARLAEYFSGLGAALLIEWVPKHDPKAAGLLGSRPDTFPDYCEEAFVEACRRHFELECVTRLPGSDRALYLFRGAIP